VIHYQYVESNQHIIADLYLLRRVDQRAAADMRSGTDPDNGRAGFENQMRLDVAISAYL
jgi:hypothetical protein